MVKAINSNMEAMIFSLTKQLLTLNTFSQVDLVTRIRSILVNLHLNNKMILEPMKWRLTCQTVTIGGKHIHSVCNQPRISAQTRIAQPLSPWLLWAPSRIEFAWEVTRQCNFPLRSWSAVMQVNMVVMVVMPTKSSTGVVRRDSFQRSACHTLEKQVNVTSIISRPMNAE